MRIFTNTFSFSSFHSSVWRWMNALLWTTADKSKKQRHLLHQQPQSHKWTRIKSRKYKKTKMKWKLMQRNTYLFRGKKPKQFYEQNKRQENDKNEVNERESNMILSRQRTVTHKILSKRIFSIWNFLFQCIGTACEMLSNTVRLKPSHGFSIFFFPHFFRLQKKLCLQPGKIKENGLFVEF